MIDRAVNDPKLRSRKFECSAPQCTPNEAGFCTQSAGLLSEVLLLVVLCIVLLPILVVSLLLVLFLIIVSDFFIGTLCIYVVCTTVCLYCTVVVLTKGLVCAVETTWPAHRGQVCELVRLYRQGSDGLPGLAAPILINVSTEGDLVTYVPFKASLGLPTSGILDDSVRYAQGDTFGCWGEARALHSTQPVTSSLLPKAY